MAMPNSVIESLSIAELNTFIADLPVKLPSHLRRLNPPERGILEPDFLTQVHRLNPLDEEAVKSISEAHEAPKQATSSRAMSAGDVAIRLFSQAGLTDVSPPDWDYNEYAGYRFEQFSLEFPVILLGSRALLTGSVRIEQNNQSNDPTVPPPDQQPLAKGGWRIDIPRVHAAESLVGRTDTRVPGGNGLEYDSVARLLIISTALMAASDPSMFEPDQTTEPLPL